MADVRFEFSSAGRIVFGAGALRDAGPIAAGLGHRALVVTGKNPERAGPLLDSLRAERVESSMFAVSGEPDLESVRRGAESARRQGCDLVISMGGGSALDAGKAISALATNGGDLLDYLEIIGRGQSLRRPSAPFIAIPTTAGTGSEVTRNAVLASPEHRLKVSLRSPLLLPRVAVVDPELTRELPPDVTARTGLDALTQLIEPYVCSRANPMTDAVCVEGMRRAARSLRRAVEDGRDRAAREDMSVASLFGGMALANAGLGAVHGFAGPIGGMFPAAPHGAICEALLPHVMAMNLNALRQRHPGSTSLRRYDEVARLLTGNAAAGADEGVGWARHLVADLRIPPLGSYGVSREHTSELVGKAAEASSMKANPVVLTPEELAEILERAL